MYAWNFSSNWRLWDPEHFQFIKLPSSSWHHGFQDLCGKDDRMLNIKQHFRDGVGCSILYWAIQFGHNFITWSKDNYKGKITKLGKTQNCLCYTRLVCMPKEIWDCVDHNKLENSEGDGNYQTTWPASWETCMQVRKQQLELHMEQQTGSK